MTTDIMDVTVIVPAYEEETTIVKTVEKIDKALKVIVVDDGSKDRTSENLIRAFGLIRLPSVLNHGFIKTREVHAVYKNERITLIRKENGRKGDAINAGINYAETTYVLIMDADSRIDRRSIRYLRNRIEGKNDSDLFCREKNMRRIRFNRGRRRDYRSRNQRNDIAAVGGRVIPVQGDSLSLLSKTILLLQYIEYYATFCFARPLWDMLDATLIISGTAGIFRRSALINVGGYSTTTVAEDMEIVCRLKRRGYKVCYERQALCFAQSPIDFKNLWKQRCRWHQGLCEVVSRYPGLMLEGMGVSLNYLWQVFVVSMSLLELPLLIYCIINRLLLWLWFMFIFFWFVVNAFILHKLRSAIVLTALQVFYHYFLLLARMFMPVNKLIRKKRGDIWGVQKRYEYKSEASLDSLLGVDAVRKKRNVRITSASADMTAEFCEEIENAIESDDRFCFTQDSAA